VDELSFRYGLMSVRREAANVLPVTVGIRDKVVQLVSVLGRVVMSVWGMGRVKGPSPIGVIYRQLDGSRACSPCVGSVVAESPPSFAPNACRRRFGEQRPPA
jgi:hypothetical protein